MKKGKCFGFAFLTVMCLMNPWSHVYGAENGTWELSEKGKHWMYFYSPADPAKDEWITSQGKEYYVDSRGYMKTGWVTDKRDGNKYYLGPDGAKSYNLFTPDDHYVGPEGLVLESFDTYRKALKKQLSSVMKDKHYKEKDPQGLPGFILMDLNGDGYKDAVAVDHGDKPQRVVMAAVWEPEDKTMALSAEADLKGEGSSWLSYNEKDQSMWLIWDGGDGWDKDYFLMDENGPLFENLWHFTVKMNQWGDPAYYINGGKASQEYWNQAAAAAQQNAGAALQVKYLPLDKEHINQAVDQAPAPDELSLWQP